MTPSLSGNIASNCNRRTLASLNCDRNSFETWCLYCFMPFLFCSLEGGSGLASRCALTPIYTVHEAVPTKIYTVFEALTSSLEAVFPLIGRFFSDETGNVSPPTRIFTAEKIRVSPTTRIFIVEKIRVTASTRIFSSEKNIFSKEKNKVRAILEQRPIHF